MTALSTTAEIPVIGTLRGAFADARSWTAAVISSVGVTATSITLHLWVLVALAPAGSPSLWERFMSWDADLYRQVAQHGYPTALTYDPKTGKLLGDNLAFSPLYPLLERFVHWCGGSWTGAAVTVSWTSMVVCLVLVHKLASDLYGPSAALPAVILVGCVQPMSLVFALGYPDGGLYLSFGLAAVLCARSNYWLWAGLFASLAGLTRPTGLAVSAVVLALALVTKGDRSRALAGAALGCVGTPLYLLWVGIRVLRPDAWFAVQQAGWGTHWDNGSSFWDFLSSVVTRAVMYDPLTDVCTAAIILGYIVLTALSARRGELGVLVVWPLVALVLALGQSNYVYVKPRLLLAAGLCLLPVAKALAKASPSVRWTVLVCGSLLSAWWGAFMLNISHWVL